MKILITGAKGQLGQDCSDILAGEHTVYPIDLQELDITDQQQVSAYLEKMRPDVVINCAAYTAVDACEKNRKLCLQVNGEGPGFIAAGCAATGSRIIHISTDYVFDGSKPVPQAYNEEEQPNPVSAYGSSKLAGEENVRKECDNHLIIRTAWLYGIGGPNFLKTMLRLACSNPQKTLRVVNDQFGSLTWSHRLAVQVKTLLETGLTGTIHATAEGYSSWYEGAQYFLRCMNVPHAIEPCTTAEYPTPALRPANSILENKVLHELGLNRMDDWQKDIELFVARFRDQLLAEACAKV
ncbi:MAG: dTDP-4-dehydrorhamnose reductase [Desulfobulbaceae bacterium]|nr:dTDP-4-dehydrorhamnose reductase [Desulfobulbaceae bacterium]